MAQSRNSDTIYPESYKKIDLDSMAKMQSSSEQAIYVAKVTMVMNSSQKCAPA